MFTPDRQINPDSFYEKDSEEKEVQKCDNCHSEEETFILGVETYGLNPLSLVCSFCLCELHQNLSLTN